MSVPAKSRSGRSNWPGRVSKVKQEPKSFRSVGTCTDAHVRTLWLAPSGSEMEEDRSDRWFELRSRLRAKHTSIIRVLYLHIHRTVLKVSKLAKSSTMATHFH